MKVLDTGGTMGKVYPRATMGYAFEFGDTSAPERILARAQLGERVEVVRVCAKDSTELTAEDRQALERAIAGSEEKRFVVAHGTDTMVQTGRGLEKTCLERGATVVLTGARVPEALKESDADFNLGFAVACAQLLGPGAYVAMNGRVVRCSEAERDEKTGIFFSTSKQEHLK